MPPNQDPAARRPAVSSICFVQNAPGQDPCVEILIPGLTSLELSHCKKLYRSNAPACPGNVAVMWPRSSVLLVFVIRLLRNQVIDCLVKLRIFEFGVFGFRLQSLGVYRGSSSSASALRRATSAREQPGPSGATHTWARIMV